jgi:hypothetical protein
MSYIYVTQNDGLPGLVQIGMTDDNPEVLRITALLYSLGVVNEEGLTRDEAGAAREAAAPRAPSRFASKP